MSTNERIANFYELVDELIDGATEEELDQMLRSRGIDPEEAVGSRRKMASELTQQARRLDFKQATERVRERAEAPRRSLLERGREQLLSRLERLAALNPAAVSAHSYRNSSGELSDADLATLVEDVERLVDGGTDDVDE